jgi:methionine-rich copper-binding protein CopC
VIRICGRLPAQLSAAVLTAALVLLPAQAAHAHAVLVSSSPKDGASIPTLPTEVSFTFDQNVARPAFVVVTAPDGSNVDTGEPAILDGTVTQRVEPPGEAGTYRMSYRVVSADGHPVSATLAFDVTTGRHVVGSDVAEDGGSSHDGLVVAAAIVLVVAAVAALLVAGRSRRPGEGL